MNNRYRFVTDWWIDGEITEVADIFKDVAGFAHWWPSVYLRIDEIEPGDADKVGCVVDLYTKGWLPYTLCWSCRVTEANYPYGFSLVSWGDFVGTGVWQLRQDGQRVHVRYTWDIEAQKRLLRRLTPILRPIFAMNHRWAMARGEESLRLEVLRRRATSPEECARIPPPPGPTWPTRPRHV